MTGFGRCLCGVTKLVQFAHLLAPKNVLWRGCYNTCAISMVKVCASTIRLQSRISKIDSVKSLRIPRGTRMPNFSF